MLVSNPMPAIAPPSASAPVSPMKTRAGGAFHQRKPTHAPMSDAATSVTSIELARMRWYACGCRNCVNAMTMNATKTSADEPDASPSSPSVMFTAFVTA